VRVLACSIPVRRGVQRVVAVGVEGDQVALGRPVESGRGPHPVLLAGRRRTDADRPDRPGWAIGSRHQPLRSARDPGSARWGPAIRSLAMGSEGMVVDLPATSPGPGAGHDFRSASFLGTRAIDAARLSSVRLAGASAWMSSIGGRGAEIGFSRGRTPCALRCDRPKRRTVTLRASVSSDRRAQVAFGHTTRRGLRETGHSHGAPADVPSR